jgi:1-aminocyclopropane-1-carboxylate deaminase/D-cysteine desulfhydrase-like pyridoxal-dependent ACC family enzyme
MATLSIRIPDSLHKGIKELATKDGYSMNQFFVTAAAEKLSSLGTIDYLRERADRASAEELEKVLALVPDVPPDPGDKL